MSAESITISPGIYDSLSVTISKFSLPDLDSVANSSFPRVKFRSEVYSP